MPAEGVESAHVHEFAWRAVGLGAVEGERAGKAEDARDGFGELPDGDVFPGADVDQGRLGF